MENKFIAIVQEPSYWVEEINNIMYDAMVNYMEKHGLNQTEFAAYLGISKGRLSQIMNSGEINFSIEKLFSIALKIDKIPQIRLDDKEEYITALQENHQARQLTSSSQKAANYSVFKISDETKITQIPTGTNKQFPIAY